MNFFIEKRVIESYGHVAYDAFIRRPKNIGGKERRQLAGFQFPSKL